MHKSTTELTLGKSIKFISEEKTENEITIQYEVSFSGVTASLNYILHPAGELLLTGGGHLLFQIKKGEDAAESKACGWVKEVLTMISKERGDRELREFYQIAG